MTTRVENLLAITYDEITDLTIENEALRKSLKWALPYVPDDEPEYETAQRLIAVPE